MTKQLICNICNNKFPYVWGKKYCSENCRYINFENKRKEKYKKCLYCNNYFFGNYSKKRFCSFKCGLENRKVKKRICQYCNSIFDPTIKCRTRKQKFCSLKCHHKNVIKNTNDLISNGFYICGTHGKMPLSEFNHRGKNRRYYCRLCNKNSSDKYRFKNIEKVKERKKIYFSNPEVKRKSILKTNEWRKNNREKLLLQRAKYREKYREQIKEKHKQQVKELKPYYVKNCMTTKLKISEIPKELIEAKKIHITLKRKLKELKDGNKKC